MTIPELIGAAIVFIIAAFAGGAWWGRRPRALPTKPPANTPPPTHTPTQHGTAAVLEEASIIDAVASDHAVDPGEVSDLMDLADKTRQR